MYIYIYICRQTFLKIWFCCPLPTFSVCCASPCFAWVDCCSLSACHNVPYMSRRLMFSTFRNCLNFLDRTNGLEVTVEYPIRIALTSFGEYQVLIKGYGTPEYPMYIWASFSSSIQGISDTGIGIGTTLRTSSSPFSLVKHKYEMRQISEWLCLQVLLNIQL